jgi:mannose-6-phosphate isomerase-like protein (cupin superfamily)
MQEIVLGRGARVRILVTAEDTGGHASVVEGVADPRIAGPPLHRHPGFTEAYVVQAGILELRRGDELLRLGPGDTAVVPPGTPHAFRVCGGEPARWLNVFSPGGFERYFAEAARLLDGDAPPDPALLAAAAARHGLEPVAVRPQDAEPVPAGR